MIASVVLSGSALSDLRPELGGADEGPLLALQEQMRSVLMHHGVLVGTAEEWVRFNAAVDALDEPDRDAWRDLLIYLERHQRLWNVPEPKAPACLDDASTPSDVECLVPIYGGSHLAVLPIAKDSAFGLSARTPSAPAGKHEAVRSLSLPQAERFKRLVALERRRFHAHRARRDELFNDVLKGLARYSREIVVADRYLFNELFHRGRRIETTESEAVGWLLDQFGRWCLPETKVILVGGFAEKGQPGDLQQAADLVNRAWRRQWGNVAEVEVRGTDWREYKYHEQLQHDRHITFSCGLAVGFAAGLDRLRKPALWDPQSTWWFYVSDSVAVTLLRDAEERIFEASGRASVTLTR